MSSRPPASRESHDRGHNFPAKASPVLNGCKAGGDGVENSAFPVRPRGCAGLGRMAVFLVGGPRSARPARPATRSPPAAGADPPVTDSCAAGARCPACTRTRQARIGRAWAAWPGFLAVHRVLRPVRDLPRHWPRRRQGWLAGAGEPLTDARESGTATPVLACTWDKQARQHPARLTAVTAAT